MGTTIAVSNENRDRLAKFGVANETMNDALGRVLDIAEKKCACACEGEQLDFA